MSARAATLSVGDELAMAQIADTNAPWLAERLSAEGLFRDEHRTVADDRDAIARAIAELAAGRTLVVTTGGLGPTADDLTRDGLNVVTDGASPLVEDDEARASLDRWFRGRGREMPASNLAQARRPRSARCIANPLGTAPGLAARIGDCMVFCLPGPPLEMRPMFESEVLPAIRSVVDRDLAVPTRAVHSYGLGEALAAERLGTLMARGREPSVGTTASQSIVTARIRAHGRRDEAERRADEAAAEVERRWWPHAFGSGTTTLAEAVIHLLRARAETVAVAESCTGGLLGSMLTSVPGASRAFVGGWIAYANERKASDLDVPREALAEFGAVSAEVAHLLAVGARARAATVWAIAITGVAGPDGGTAEKPVGTVFVAVAGEAGVRVRRFRFGGERAQVRQRSALAALQMLRFEALGVGDEALLWTQADGERGGALRDEGAWRG